MTEREWLTCTDPDPMVRHLWENGSKRKLRLFAIACCQRILPLVGDARYHATVTAAEDFVDGLIPVSRVGVIEAECLAAPMPEGGFLNPNCRRNRRGIMSWPWPGNSRSWHGRTGL